jgi:hypothetical protein
MLLNDKKGRSMKLKRYITAICALIFASFCETGCRGEIDEPKEKIESITFDRERVVIKINEEAAIRVTAKSDAAKKNEKITYASVNEGIIAIREPTNDGFIVKGLRGGTTVITAKSQLVTNYFEVVVESEDITAQYITVAQPVIEILENERRSTQVSLYGGSVLDNNNFEWRLENGKDNIAIDVTANIAVITGLQRGHQKIMVSHPKADFTGEILVFVKGVDEAVQYISGQSNVVVVPNDGQYHNFEVILVNGKPEAAINFEHEVYIGRDNIEVVRNGNVFNVKGIKSGTSVIQIAHPLAIADFDVRIIVYDVDIPFIVLEQTFLLMNIGESVNVGAAVEFARNGMLSQNEFSYEIVENDIVVEVVQNNHYFYIRARKGGSARIIIRNPQAEMPREILVIVREEVVYRDDYYITTGQNVIMTQMGAEAIQLNMQLANGNPADANSFEWVVDDGTVIVVESAHGIVRNSRSVVNSVFNAIALITPKKTGIAKITVSHPKSEVTATVMVKVYPKNTFAEIPVLVGYEGLIKVKSGAESNDPDRSPKTIQLRMMSGDISDVGTLHWSTSETNIASVRADAHGVVNVLSAAGNGLTRMRVEGPNLQYPHESLVLAGMPEFVDMSSVIYVDSAYQKMVTNQTIRIEVKDSQGMYSNSGAFSVEVDNKNLLYAVMIKNQLVLQGKEAGETFVRITHQNAINDITINVFIEPSYINMDKPYYIGGPEIKGVVRGWFYNDSLPNLEALKVTLVGAGEADKGKLIWSIDDPGVASIITSSGSCFITGKISGRQTKIRVSHQKAEGEKVIILYVVENESDLNSKVVLELNSENYLLTKGEDKLISLITNASESQKLGLKWKIKNEAEGVMTNNIISIDPHYDSAMIRARGAGHAEIMVTHEDNILPLSIYVSVVDTLSEEKIINSPSIIELIRGESKIVSVNHVNLDSIEVSNIRWKIENENSEIAALQENGDSAYLLGLKKGVDYVNIRQEAIGYKHRATLICANTAEELASMYVIGAESSYHTMLMGEEKRIKLSFGSAGFPEAAKSTIKWTADKTGTVRVIGQGESATVVAMNEGIGTVKIESETSFNSLELTFEVRKYKVNEYEFRGHEKIKGMVVGESARITMRIYEGDAEITHNYAQIYHENDNNNIIGVNRVDNIIDITAKNVGQSYITVQHKQVNDPARILVYTANTLEELDNYYPVLIEKTNYLLQVGESATIKIETIESKDEQYFKNVSWGIENASVINNADFNGKKEIVIKGRAEGLCTINISYQGSVVGRIFVTVVSNDSVDMTKYIVTENIIGLVKGESYSTKIFSNLGAGEIAAILWESTDHGIVTVNGSGENGVLSGINKGEAYVTVSYGSWLKRHILVFVCDNKTQADSHRAMNMEQQYYRAGLNETLILPLYYAPNKTSVPTLWIDKYDNKVVRFNALENGGKLEITTLNEGVAVLEAVNTGLSNPNGILHIYIEVSKKYNNAPKTPEVKFLTITKTVYVMNPDEINVPLDLSVSGVGYSVNELANVKWKITNGSRYVSIYPNGKNCQVKVNQFGLEGEAELEAYYVDNIINIKIIVSRTGLMGFPHITGEDVIRAGLGAKVLFEYNVVEIASYDKNLFHVDVVQGKNSVNAKMTGNMLEIEGKAAGQALLSITCNTVCDFAKNVVVIVTTTPDGLVYLTTQNNFSQIKIDELKVLSVDMVGFNNTSDQGYVWTVDPNHAGYIDLHYTGKQAQVRGLAEGAGKTARIVVSNSLVDPLFNLTMYVRVSNADINTVYITTRHNIISVVEGKSAYLEAELVNGGPGDNNLLQWSSRNPGIISVAGAGSQAVVVGKTVGIGRVSINYGGAVNNGIEILVIVEKDMSSMGIYITANSTLIDMKPNDTKQVSVNLVGGAPADIAGFQWNIINSESVVKINGNNQEVIRLALNTGNSQNYITGIREGEATVRVTHPRTNHMLDIKVYVRQYSTIRFVQRNINVEVGKTAQVLIEAPAGTTVYYTANKYKDPVTQVSRDVVRVSGTNSICIVEGIAEGICIVSASDARGTMTDELVVQVQPSTNRTIQYIQTPDIIYNMTDWQSALNRAMIAGSTVGEKYNGLAFTEADDALIHWAIEKGNGEDIIGFGDGLAANTESIGKMVSVYTKGKPGNGIITVTHPYMSGYRKEIYVNVYSHNSNFTITPIFLDMQVGQIKTIDANLNNLVEKPYHLINWEAKGDLIEVVDGITKKKGIEITEIKNEGKTAEIKALSDGVYVVEASFNGSFPPLEATVYIEKERKFEVLDDTFIALLPGETRIVGLFIEPKNADIAYYTDYLEYLTINYIGPIESTLNKWGEQTGGLPNEYRELYNTYKPHMRENVNAVLIITGKERLGFTQIRLTSSKIERMLTVDTNRNYTFYMKGVEVDGVLRETSVIRGKPNQAMKIVYEVFPKYDNVIFNSGTDTEYNPLGIGSNKKVVRNINIKKSEQTIDLILDNCGYGRVEFLSEYNDNFGVSMIIPTYVYYDRIDLWWELKNIISTNHNNPVKTFHSRLDSATNALYIADGERVFIDYMRDDLGYPTGNYYGADVEFTGMGITGNSEEYNIFLEYNTSNNSLNIFHEYRNNDQKVNSVMDQDVLSSVNYVGILTIYYQYSTGGESKSAFKRNIMIFKEKWARVP